MFDSKLFYNEEEIDKPFGKNNEAEYIKYKNNMSRFNRIYKLIKDEEIKKLKLEKEYLRHQKENNLLELKLKDEKIKKLNLKLVQEIKNNKKIKNGIDKSFNDSNKNISKLNINNDDKKKVCKNFKICQPFRNKSKLCSKFRLCKNVNSNDSEMDLFLN